MTVHIPLLTALTELGYAEQAGICHGFTIKWLEAAFLGKKT